MLAGTDVTTNSDRLRQSNIRGFAEWCSVCVFVFYSVARGRMLVKNYTHKNKHISTTEASLHRLNLVSCHVYAGGHRWGQGLTG